MKYSKEAKEKALKELRTLAHRTVYAKVTRVARSGMSRHIEYYVVDDDREVRRITWSIAALSDNSIDDDGLVAHGCGMDMIFAVLSNVNTTVAFMDYPGKTYEEINAIAGNNFYEHYLFDTRYRSL